MKLPSVAHLVGVVVAIALPESSSFTISARDIATRRPFSCLTVPSGPFQRIQQQQHHHQQLSSTASPTTTSDETDEKDGSWDDLIVSASDFEPLVPTGDALVSSQDNADANDAEDYDLSLMEFVDMIIKSPVGTMDDQEIAVLPQIMQSVALDHNHSNDDGTEARAAERLLYRITAEWQAAVKAADQQERAEMLQPTSDDVLLVMQAWENTITTDEKGRTNTNTLPEALDHIWSLFNNHKTMARSGIDSLQLTSNVGRLVLRTLASSRDRGMDRKIWTAFEELQDMPSVEVDAKMYGSVILSLAKSRDRQAADRAENMLRQAAELFPPDALDDDTGESTGIGVDSFNVVLVAWAKSGQEDGPARAEKLIVFMDQLDADYGELGLVKPNVSSFTSLIDAYCQTNEWDNVGEAEGILNRLLNLFLEGEEGESFEPNIASWTIVISAWGRMSKNKRKGAAARAARLLKRMESLHDEGRITFAPDAIAYVTCMNAFAFSKTPDGPVRAEEILNELHERYLDGDDSMKPSAKSIQIIIDAWVKSSSPGAIRQAELALDQYEDLLEEYAKEEPSVVSKELTYIYRGMLFGWAKEKEPLRAQEYLSNMMERGMEVDSFCFDKVIEANTASDDEDSMKRTFELFEIMEDHRQKGNFEPNERVYTSFIRAMTRSRVANLAYKASVILKRMEGLYQDGNRAMKPTVFTYNAVLNACAESASSENSNPAEAFKVALKVFNDLRNARGEELDHVSFGNMLRCANLLPTGRQKDALIATTFQMCCKEGFVNSYILRDLQYAASEEVWRPLLQRAEGEPDMDLLPLEWSRQLQRRI